MQSTASKSNHSKTRLPRAFKGHLWGLLALGLLIHVGFGFLLGFSVDEAHYAFYAVKLDWSYFDHPPLVGWLQWPLVTLQAPVGILRLIPQALWFVSCVIAWQLARDPSLPVLIRLPLARDSDSAAQKHLFDQTQPRELAGLCAVGLVLLAPLMHVLAVGLLPDTLLMALALGLMKLTLSICQHETPKSIRVTQWLLLGVLLGLAGLSKYTAVFSALAVAVILLSRFGLVLFSNVGLCLAASVAVILISPVLYWNISHDWISFKYQLNHGSGGEWQVKRFLLFFVIQLGAFGPLLVGTSAVVLWLGVKQKNTPALTILLFFLIPFGITAALSGGGGLPHWTAPAWLAVTPFAARLIVQDWLNGRRWLISILAVFQVVVCTFAFVLLFFGGLPTIERNDRLGKQNPFADLWGWDKAGSVARDLAVKLEAPAITVSNWTLASRMTWYSQPVPVYVLDDRFDQFDIWFGQIPDNSNAIFVNWSQMKYDLPTGPGQFKSCERLTNLSIRRLNREIAEFEFFYCKHWGNRP